jgi:hypothetical protein
MITQSEAKNRWITVMCACAVCACGCATRRTPVKPVVDFVATVHPMTPAAHSTELESPPDVPAEPVQEPPEIGAERLQPPKPHVAAPEPADSSRTGKHPEPTIAPEVATEELTEAKAETQRNLDVAERNLLLAQGKKLNATQEDLASKVRGFADNAREAMRSGDWVRAKNLSSKAELLAEQLVGSF